MKIKIIESYLTRNPRYTDGVTINVEGLMLHSVGCPQPKASAFVSSWNNPNFILAVHAFVDGLTGDVYNTLPWNRRAYHCGSGPKGSGNRNYIAVEMCEPASIRYTSGANFICTNLADARAVAKMTYASAVQLFAQLCKKYNLDPKKDGVILSHREGHARGIASNHGDPEHIWQGLSLGYTMDGFRADVAKTLDELNRAPAEEKTEEKNKETEKVGLKCKDLKDLPEAEIIRKVGPLFTKDQKETGILACVSMAQFILESGYGKTTKLALTANNCFGMKANLSNNQWGGSTWDGKSVINIATQEQDKNGHAYTIHCDFRAYPCIEDSIGDHSAYLIGAKNGEKRRYSGLVGENDYKTAIHIIKSGGYATDVKYESKLANIIERWGLTAYNYNGTEISYEPEQLDSKPYYRVRKSWEDEASQLGAYHDMDNAKRMADSLAGYSVFDENGICIYQGAKASEETTPDRFTVRVDVKDLNIRTGAGTNYRRVAYIPVGIYTIVQVRQGLGSDSGWGKLLSGAGWISLDYATRLR